MPWNLSIGYNYRWAKPNSFEDGETQSNGLEFSGSMTLSQKWAVTGRVNYNILTNEFTNPDIVLTRDLHCWTMNFQWTPFGLARGYRFFIGVKSGQLSDLQYKKENTAAQRLRF